MSVDVLALSAIIYEAASIVIEQCRLVKLCHAEAARIAMRTQNVLRWLQSAAEEFQGNLALETSMLELRQLLEETRDLMARCTRPRRMARIREMVRMKATRGALIHVETELGRVTNDLR